MEILPPASKGPELLQLLKGSTDEARELRALYEQLILDLRPEGTLSRFMVYEIAQILLALKELNEIREATFNAAMRVVIEQCLKDVPSKDAEAHAKYILVGAKADAIAWQSNKIRRRKINAQLKRAGYDLGWIKSRAYEAAKETLERLDRTIAFHEERRRRLLHQLGPVEAVLTRLESRLIEGKAGIN